MKQTSFSWRGVFNIASAFMAWVIGSGFATGQEVFQFFSSYGYWSYGVIAIIGLGFLIIGKTLLLIGYENRDNPYFDSLKYFSGEKLGTFYTWLIRITVLILMSVLVSGAGSTLNQFYGFNKYIGSAIMIGMVLFVYLLGFDRLINIVSSIGPIIIIFSILVGLFSVIKDADGFSEIGSYREILNSFQPAPNWLVSGILYLPLSLFCGSAYFVEVGKSANNQYEAKYGAIMGAVLIVITTSLINTAILLNSQKISKVAIPMLFLAKNLSYSLGAIFSIILILGSFCSCSTMMWVISSGFQKYGPRANKVAAIIITILTYIIGLFPFAGLIATFYPIIGYLGLPFIALVAYRSREKSIS